MLGGSKRHFEHHKNNQSDGITFTPGHFVSMHGLPSVHQRAPLPTSPLPRSFSQTLPTPDEVLTQLRTEIAQQAQSITAKAERRLAIEAQLSRPKLPRPPIDDFRAPKNEAAKQRKEEIRQRSFDHIQTEIRKKREAEEEQQRLRALKANQREIAERELAQEQAEKAQSRAAQAEQYRKQLETLQNFPTKFGTEQWKTASATVSDLGTLIEARYTKKHPKVVYTDPIAYEYPRSPQAERKQELGKNAAVFFGVEGGRSMSQGLLHAGKLTLAPMFMEPVRDKHSGLNYTDTRQLLR